MISLNEMIHSDAYLPLILHPQNSLFKKKMIISSERINVIFCSYLNASYNYVAFLSFRKLCGNVCYCSRILKIIGICIIFDELLFISEVLHVISWPLWPNQEKSSLFLILLTSYRSTQNVNLSLC